MKEDGGNELEVGGCCELLSPGCGLAITPTMSVQLCTSPGQDRATRIWLPVNTATDSTHWVH